MSRPSENDEFRCLRGRLAEGEAAAFAEAYDLFGPRLYRYAARILGGRNDAEDVVQELFVSLVRSRTHLLDVENLSAYLFASLRRLTNRAAEKRRRGPRLCSDLGDGYGVDEHADDTPAAGDNARGAQELREQLDMALRALPDEQREVIVMKMDGELTFGEIARALDISPNTAASRYRYGLEKLRAMLSDSDSSPGPAASQVRD
jgi:RNA polymerase sigma-70 factor (ECF subfamily)